MAEVFGTIAVILSLCCILVGLPVQIYKNYEQQSCKGFSFWFGLFSFFSSVAWFGHGWSKPNLFLCISNVPSAIFMLVILAQFWMYRKQEPKEETEEEARQEVMETV